MHHPMVISIWPHHERMQHTICISAIDSTWHYRMLWQLHALSSWADDICPRAQGIVLKLGDRLTSLIPNQATRYAHKDDLYSQPPSKTTTLRYSLWIWSSKYRSLRGNPAVQNGSLLYLEQMWLCASLIEVCMGSSCSVTSFSPINKYGHFESPTFRTCSSILVELVEYTDSGPVTADTWNLDLGTLCWCQYCSFDHPAPHNIIPSRHYI